METLEKFILPVDELIKRLNYASIPYEVEKHFDGFIIYMPCKKYRYCDVVLDSQSYGKENNNFEYCFATYKEIPTDENIQGNLTIDEVVKKFKERHIELNKWLVEEYPFLLPTSNWDGMPVKNYDYSYTELDELPPGWYKTFGIDMCREIKNVLLDCQMKDPTGGYPDWEDENKKIPYLKGFKIIQIKEKYGTLRFCINGTPELAYNAIRDIIDKYEEMSGKICIDCGKPIKYETTGWITFICEDCGKKLIEKKGKEAVIELKK